MPLKLLAVGDIHLGRQPSRLPEELAGEAGELAPAAAWRRLVERAIREQVDVVALAGDVVEREEDFYEAYRELSRGVTQLAEAGIQVVGVAGNHDVHVLPRLADQLDDFDLIGRDGEWQTRTLEAGGEALTLHGWSFRQERVLTSPLEGTRFERGPGTNLGLLHCDLDAAGSPYAPVASAELQSAGLDGWLLGHIHKPHALTRDNPVGYLGCVSGMDPGEPGDHGPWLFTLEGGAIKALEQWILAPLRWEPLTLDITDLEQAADAKGRLIETARQRDERLASLEQPPLAVGLRLRLIGRTDLGRQVEDLLRQDIGSIIHDGGAGTRYFLERCLSDTRPAMPLAELAEQPGPPGLLARRLQWLEQPDSTEAQRLIAEGRARLERQRRDARWQALRSEQDESLPDAAVVDWLKRAGSRLLEDMLAQQQGGAE